MALFQPTFLSPPEAYGSRHDARRVPSSTAGVFYPPVLLELLGRSPSLTGVAGCPFSFVASADGEVLDRFMGMRIECGISEAGLLPTPLLGGDPTPSFLAAPSLSADVSGPVRGFFVIRERIHSWLSSRVAVAVDTAASVVSWLVAFMALVRDVHPLPSLRR